MIDINLEEVREYTLNGFSHSQTARALNISRSTLYVKSDIMDTIKKAEFELRQQVAKDILSSSNGGEVTAQIFLSKRLNLFSVSYEMPQVKDMKTALQQINIINQDLASGEIPSELANNLIKNIGLFIKTYESSELEKKLDNLEEKLNNGKY